MAVHKVYHSASSNICFVLCGGHALFDESCDLFRISVRKLIIVIIHIAFLFPDKCWIIPSVTAQQLEPF